MNVTSELRTTVNGTSTRATSAGLSILATLFFMWGFVTVLNDVLVPHLKSVFALNYTQTLLIQFVFFGAYFLLALPGARLIELVGYKRAIVTALIVTAIGAAIFVPASTLPSYPLFLLALFVLASGITVLQVAANPYVALMGSPQTSSSRLNLVQAFNSLGAACAPYVGGQLILGNSVAGRSLEGALITPAQRMADALAVRAPYIGITVLFVALALVIALWPLPKPAANDAPEGHVGESILRKPRLLFGIGAIFFYVGAEIAVGSFLINYISSARVGNMPPDEAAFYVTLFWSGAMAGRFLGAGILRMIRPHALLAANAALAAMLVFVSIVTGGHAALWSIVLVGLMNSIMFPTIFTLAIEGLGHLTQRGSGLLIMAIVGGAVIPLTQAAIADRLSLQISFILPIVCYSYVLFFALRCRTPVTQSGT